jgi:hypothetical protein
VGGILNGKRVEGLVMRIDCRVAGETGEVTSDGYEASFTFSWIQTKDARTPTMPF